MAALTKDGYSGQTYTITGPEALTPLQVTDTIAKAIGREVAKEYEGRVEFDACSASELFHPIHVRLQERVGVRPEHRDGVRHRRSRAAPGSCACAACRAAPI